MFGYHVNRPLWFSCYQKLLNYLAFKFDDDDDDDESTW
jgi:hypothetical protein